MAAISIRRRQKELNDLQTPPAGIKLLETDGLAEWKIEISVLGDSVYQGEVFALRFKFGTYVVYLYCEAYEM